MYDAVLVLIEAFNKFIKKKIGVNSTKRSLDCNTGNQSNGWVTPWEHGDKISKFLRKVKKKRLHFFVFISKPVAFIKDAQQPKVPKMCSIFQFIWMNLSKVEKSTSFHWAFFLLNWKAQNFGGSEKTAFLKSTRNLCRDKYKGDTELTSFHVYTLISNLQQYLLRFKCSFSKRFECHLITACQG